MTTSRGPDGPQSPNSKPTARSYFAASKTTNGLSPLQWGDKCFLCGNTIGEGASIDFYQGKNAFMRCHRHCKTFMDMHGGTPKDFHEAKEAKLQSPVYDKPVHQDVINETSQVEVAAYNGPRSIKFDDFAHMQAFIASRGPLPEYVRITVGDYVMQAGG